MAPTPLPVPDREVLRSQRPASRRASASIWDRAAVVDPGAAQGGARSSGPAWHRANRRGVGQRHRLGRPSDAGPPRAPRPPVGRRPLRPRRSARQAELDGRPSPRPPTRSATTTCSWRCTAATSCTSAASTASTSAGSGTRPCSGCGARWRTASSGRCSRSSARPAPTAAPEEMDVALRAIADADDAPSVSRYVERHASLEQVLECSSSARPTSSRRPTRTRSASRGWTGPPKAAFVEIQSDEYGGGRGDRIHSTLFANTMDALGLDSTLRRLPRPVPGTTLAAVNLDAFLGLHRRWRGALVGHLALFEMGSSVPNSRYARGLRRLGRAGGGAGLLRRARARRRGAREHRRRRPRRRAGAAGARAVPPTSSGAPAR